MDVLSCPSCKKTFENNKDFSQPDNLTSLCLECGQKPQSKVSLVHSDASKKLGCQVNEKSPSNEVINQTESLVNDKYYACDTCGRKFRGKYNLVEHFKIHTGEKDHPCYVCGKMFRHKSAMKAHVRMHTGEKNYECNICKRRFTFSSSLRDHLSAVHSSNNGQKFSCDGCQKTFKSRRYLCRHKRRKTCVAENSGKKRVKGKETFESCTMSVPSGEKGYVCLVCGKQYRHKTTMRNHILFHTREKVHTCDYCGKEFQEKKHLRIHTTIHTGDREHLCTICGKRFSQMSHLRAHMRKHTGEKKFVCEDCGSSFTIKTELRRHMIKHTGDNRDRILCEICGKLIANRYSFRRHTITHKEVRRKCGRKKKVYKDAPENELVKCNICEHFIEAKDFEEHCKDHLKLEILSDELISEDKELKDSMNCIKKEVQHSEAEELCLEISYDVKLEEMEEEDIG